MQRKTEMKRGEEGGEWKEGETEEESWGEKKRRLKYRIEEGSRHEAEEPEGAVCMQKANRGGEKMRSTEESSGGGNE